MKRYRLFVLPFIVLACKEKPPQLSAAKNGPTTVVAETPIFYSSIGKITTPQGFKRIDAADDSFTGWLRTIPLKKEKTVYLYDGTKKRNQGAQFAVIDIPTGNKDLQQCADVVMRLRAEYLFKYKKYKEIAFMDYAGKWYRWSGGDNRRAFDNYLQTVFGWCGSASLEKQLKTVTDFNAIKPGDVLVQGGFPGHAVIVADMATNAAGKKAYLLVQGYQPAQDMHVLVNPNDLNLSPWYAVDIEGDMMTPEWTFKKTNLKTW
jgi:hypothetical protein